MTVDCVVPLRFGIVFITAECCCFQWIIKKRNFIFVTLTSNKRNRNADGPACSWQRTNEMVFSMQKKRISKLHFFFFSFIGIDVVALAQFVRIKSRNDIENPFIRFQFSIFVGRRAIRNTKNHKKSVYAISCVVRLNIYEFLTHHCIAHTSVYQYRSLLHRYCGLPPSDEWNWIFFWWRHCVDTMNHQILNIRIVVHYAIDREHRAKDQRINKNK